MLRRRGRILPPGVAAALCLSVGRIFAVEPGLPASPADPRDISGVWFGIGYQDSNNFYFKPVEGGEPPFTAEGLALHTKRTQAAEAGTPERDPASECMPHGVPHVISTPTPFQIIQTPGQVTFIHEASRNVRIVYMDEKHPPDIAPTFLGHSVGRWEGDTLVVDTIGLRSEPWLDFGGTPGSERLHVVERWRKIDGGKRLEVLVRIEDPKMYTRPWTARRDFLWSPDERIEEYVCEESLRIEPGARRSNYRP
jgi:hypothetical protein